MEHRRDGSTVVRYRLADARTGYVTLTDGVYATADHDQLAEAIRSRLPPPAPFAQ